MSTGLKNLVLSCLLIALCAAVGPPKHVGPYQTRQVAKVGQTRKKFVCPVSADPPDLLMVHWIKDGVSISDGLWPRFRITKEGSLRIRDISMEDAGKYVCKATNGFGSINVNFSLIVIDKETGERTGPGTEDSEVEEEEEDPQTDGSKIKTKPVLVGPDPMNETVDIGQTASFLCKVKSVVQPHIQWLKRIDKGSELELNNSATIEVQGQRFVVLKTAEVWKDSEGFFLNKLVIKNVHPANVGMYICLGANSMGYRYRSAFLHLKDGHIMNSGRRDAAASGDPEESSLSLPLMIAIPSCVVIVVVILAIFFLQRRHRCNTQSNSHRNTRFNAVPTQEREVYQPAVQANPHMIPHMAPSGRTSVDKMSKNHNLDFYSDISSVSRCHHQQQPHPSVQYGY